MQMASGTAAAPCSTTPHTAGRGCRASRAANQLLAPAIAPESMKAGRKPRRREQLLEFLPANRVGCICRRTLAHFPGNLRLDVLPDHILPQVVIDDIAPVLIEESHALCGPLARH